MNLSGKDLFDFGKVVGLHGLQGDLKVKPFTPGSDDMVHAQTAYLRDRTGVVTSYTPKRVAAHKGNILLRLDGVESVELAGELVGLTVQMRLEELPKLPDGAHYLHELQGFTVIDRHRGDIGILEELFTTAAHDIYEVHGSFGEVLIPVVDAFILEVDLEGKRIQVDLPEGLIPESDEN